MSPRQFVSTWASRTLATVTPRAWAGSASLGAGLVLLATGSPAGVAIVLAALAVLVLGDMRVFVFASALALPISVVGWHLPIAQVAGRTLDVRLVLTFGIAALVAFALSRLAFAGYRPDRLELAMIALIGYVVVDGMLRSSSVFVWAPYAARWVSYLGMFAIARRAVTTLEGHGALSAAALTGFAVPCIFGLAEFALGGAAQINEASRGTGLGVSGPIALAFAGQFALITAYFLPRTTPESNRVWPIVLAAVGGVAIVASATRTVLLTAWAAVVIPTLIWRHWKKALVVTLLFTLALVARPDFLGRFIDALQSGTNGSFASAPPGASASPEIDPSSGDEVTVDRSLRFRVFVWRTVLEAWADTPILGIGPGMTAAAVSAVSRAERIPPHNDYVGVLGELGVIGLVLYLGIQLSVVWHLMGAPPHKWLKAIRQVEKRRIGALALFLGFNVLGALNNPTYFLDVQIAMWALIGAALSGGMGAPSGGENRLRDSMTSRTTDGVT